MKNVNMNNSGYFTVEAVLILPIALAIILLVMQIWFFRYNRLLQENDTCGVLVRSSHMQELNADERVSYVVSELQTRYKDKYIAWNFGEISSSDSKGILTCTVTGRSGFSPGWHYPWTDRAESVAVTQKSRRVYSELSIIRNYRKLLGLNERLSDLSDE